MEIQLYNVYEDGKLILKDAKPEQTGVRNAADDVSIGSQRREKRKCM